jgi:hypothetical protein
MSWQKVERTKSKQLDTPAPGTPLGSPAAPTMPPKPPTKPKAPPAPSTRPPHPYEMNDSEARSYRWRWVDAGLIDADYPDTDELVRYTLEVLRAETNDPVAYIAAIDAADQKQKRLARRAYRMAFFQGLRQ